MKDFNELFETAQSVADRRKKVFNELIKKTSSEILPKFCEACRGFDLKEVYFKTNNQTIGGQELQKLDYGIEFYALAINVQEKTIEEVEIDYPNGYKKFSNSDVMTFDEPNFKKTGIIEFVNLLNNRLADYIDKFDARNDVAENL